MVLNWRSYSEHCSFDWTDFGKGFLFRLKLKLWVHIRPSAMFVYMKQKIHWRMFANTRNLIGRLEMKSRLWLDNVETPNRPPEAHARWTHFEVQPKKYCLSQSAKSKIPYHLITGYTDCPRVVVRTSGNDIALAGGEGNISFPVCISIPVWIAE